MHPKPTMLQISILLALTLVLPAASRAGYAQNSSQAQNNTQSTPSTDKPSASPTSTSQSFEFPLAKNVSGYFHFVVKQPGPISVTVSGTLAKGEGVTVQVLGPGNTPLVEGDLNTAVHYIVTAADVKRGTGWLVRVLPKRKGAANARPAASAPVQQFVFMPGRRRTSQFNFTVTHAGPITVEVHSGVKSQNPLLLRLQGPNGVPSITGSLDSAINYTVTEDDVSRGRFWTAQIVATPPKAPKPGVTAVIKTPVPATADTSGPQKIQLSVAHNRSGYFSFTVTRPGPISIEITGSPKPKSVHITGPKQTPSLTGSTAKPISYTVTAADVARGPIWTAEVTAANIPAATKPAATNKTGTKTNKTDSKTEKQK